MQTVEEYRRKKAEYYARPEVIEREIKRRTAYLLKKRGSYIPRGTRGRPIGPTGKKAERNKFDANSRDKQYARLAVKGALGKGLIIKPNVCSDCGKNGRIEAHHYLGYEKEHWLDVQWFCPKCHVKHDLSIK